MRAALATVFFLPVPRSPSTACGRSQRRYGPRRRRCGTPVITAVGEPLGEWRCHVTFEPLAEVFPDRQKRVSTAIFTTAALLVSYRRRGADALPACRDGG